MFFATPHLGSEVADQLRYTILSNVCRAVGIETNQSFLDNLKSRSQWIEQQLAQYASISQDFGTIFLYEGYPTSLLGGSVMVRYARDLKYVNTIADRSPRIRLHSRCCQCGAKRNQQRSHHNCQVWRMWRSWVHKSSQISWKVTYWSSTEEGGRWEVAHMGNNFTRYSRKGLLLEDRKLI